MGNSLKKWKVSRYVLYLLLFCGSCMIAWNTPFCHDEWRWSTPERLELMKTGFQNYNGRYLGNILAVFITRNEVFRMFLMGGCFCLLVWSLARCIPKQVYCFGTAVCSENIEKSEPYCFLFTIMAPVLLLLMPQQLYEQSLGWSAAFVNFIPPVILFLIWFSMDEEYVFQKEGRKPSLWICVSCILLCFCAQLFSEHNTIAFVLFTLASFLFCVILRRRAILFSAFSLAGTAAGAAVMFTNGAYHRAAVRPNGYKHIAVAFSTLAEQWHGTITEYLCYKPLLLHILLAVSLLVMTLLYMSERESVREEHSSRNKGPAGIWFCNIVVIFCVCFFAFQSANSNWFIVHNTAVNNILRDVIILAFYLCVLILAVSLTVPEERAGNAAIWIMIALVSAPLTAAAPIGARCFFVTYVFEIVLLFRLMAAIVICIPQKICREIIFRFLMIAGTVLFLSLGVFYLRSFTVIGAAVKDRKARIESAVKAGADVVQLPSLPLTQFYWTSQPTDENFLPEFKYFYHIPETMTVEFI